MPLDTGRYDLVDEIEDVEETIAEKVDERERILDELDDDEDPPRQVDVLASEIGTLRRHKRGLEWVVADHDSDVTVTLGALTAGEMALVEDESPDGVGDGAIRNYFVAAGTVDAPWLAHDADAPTPEDYQQTVANVANLPPGVVRWAETRINSLASVDLEEGNA